MPTAIDTATASQDAAGNISLVILTGTSDDCPGGALTIQINDASSGELLAFGAATSDAGLWSKTLTVPEDVAVGQLSCGQDLQIALFCRQGTVTTQLPLQTDTIRIQCPCVSIGPTRGVPSPGPGLLELHIRGTAAGCPSIRVTAALVNGNETVSTQVPVVSGLWSAVITAEDPGGAVLKGFACDAEIDVTATCATDRSCTATVRTTIECGGCTTSVYMQITPPGGDALTTANLTCAEFGSGDYQLTASSPTGSALTVIKWTEANSVTDTVVEMQTAQGDLVTSNPLLVNVAYPDDVAMNVTYTVLVQDSQGCIAVASATFSCGGEEGGSDVPVDCVVSDWSNWSRCENGIQRRSRTVLQQPRNGGAPCPTLEETIGCPPEIIDCEVSDWSDWSACDSGTQRRTRQVVTNPQNGGRPCPVLEETQTCRDEITCGACCIWNWINIGVFIAAAIAVIVALCSLDAAAATALGTLLTGGALGPVLAALSGFTIVMLIVSVLLLVGGLISWITWLIVCHNNANICDMLATLMLTLSLIVLISGLLAFIFALLGRGPCAAAAGIDVAWFGIMLAITTLVFGALGCFDRGNGNGV